MLIRAFVLLGLCTHSGCIDKLDVPNYAFEPKPIVNSIIVAGKRVTVYVSLTVGLQSSKASIVDNAEVLLFANNELIETLEHKGDGVYKSQLLAQEETEYRCEVTIPGYPKAVCSTIIPKKMRIIRFEHINKAGVDEEGLTYPAVKVTFENDINTPVHYELKIKLFPSEGEIDQPSLTNIIDPVLHNEGLPLAVFSNELMKTNTYTMIINYTTGSALRTSSNGWITDLYPIQVELRTTCSNYYKFTKQRFLYVISNSEPIFSPGATSTFNLYSNVDNGYGIFAGYTTVESSIIYP